MTTLMDRARPVLLPEVGRAALAATRGDAAVHAGTALMLLAGLRPGEVADLLVRDWILGADPKVTVPGRSGPAIRVAPTAAAAVNAYLAGRDAELDEPLLAGLERDTLPYLFADAARQAQLTVHAHDLRRAAMAVVLEDGTPVRHLEAYFGTSASPARAGLPPIDDGYDRGIAALLEQTFAG
jgi:integrase